VSISSQFILLFLLIFILFWLACIYLCCWCFPLGVYFNVCLFIYFVCIPFLYLFIVYVMWLYFIIFSLKVYLSLKWESRNLMGPKTLPTIWGTYMKLVTKYQISVINSCREKCDEKCAYMFNVYKNQPSRQTGSRNLTGPKNATHNMVYLYDACDQISDFCHQQLLRKMWRKI
jgi:hypothetical protein